MRISSRFTIATHALVCIEHFGKQHKVTSAFIAESVNVNPVVIRRILGQLKDVDIVSIEAGVGGASIVGNPADITLLDVFRAVEGEDYEMFRFHDNPNPNCEVGRNIHAILDGELEAARKAFERRLEARTLQDLVDHLDTKLA